MAQQSDNRGRDHIQIGRAEAERAIVLIHGYTGSPGDFGSLPDELARELQARVYAPLLPGHGTQVEDLLSVSFDQLYEAARAAVASAQATHRTVAIAGHSFGGQLALLLAAEMGVAAVCTTVVPFMLRPPFSLPGARFLAQTKKLWKKHLPPEELSARRDAFYYPEMPGIALLMVHEGNKRLRRALPHVTAPILMIHAQHDMLSYPESGRALLALCKSRIRRTALVKNGRHSVFFGDSFGEVSQEIKEFLSATLSL